MRSIAVAAALAVALSTTPAAAADTTPHLPAPTGRQPVGTTALHLTDTSRPDPWVPTVPYRELMVSMFYPTNSANGPKKQYMTPTESIAYLERQNIPGLPLDVMSTVRTNAVVDARPVGRRHSLPLVVLSPGYTNSRHTLSALAEELASNGYVVAVIDHTYENRAMTFPDGRVLGCDTCAFDDRPGFDEQRGWVRAADVSFVIDELTDRHPDWQGAELVDGSRIAMGGQSAGGAAAIPAMVTDNRIDAGFDLDGSTYSEIPDPGLSRPFMFMGSMDSYVPGSGGPYRNWERDWQRMTGWKRWAMVTGTVHSSFTDLGMLADQLGIDIGSSIEGERAVAVTRAYVRAFVDQHLRCTHQPLLTGPSASYPEVSFIG